jgi:ribosomal protein S18 acetylase RimI-like enzyme
VGGKDSNGDALVIRSFSSADQQEVRRLILDGLGDHFSFIDETLNPDLDDIAKHYLERGHAVLVAMSGDKLVGTGALLREAERKGRLVRISVSKESRRRGIGRELVVRLLHVARQRRYRRILVETNHDWYDAIALYQSHGFVEYDRDEESIHMYLDLQ